MTTPAPQDVDAEVRRMFGEVAAFLSHPELGPVLRKAAQEGWDSSRLFGALQQTKWWQSTPDPARKYLIVKTLDPATAQRQVAEQQQAILDLARSEGITLSPQVLQSFAQEAVQQGYSQSEIRERLYKRPGEGGMSMPVSQQYGYLAAYLNDAEVGPLLQQGAREGWTERRLEAELQKTSFWRSTTESVRRFTALEQQDPMRARQVIDQARASIATMAQGIGANLDGERLNTIARNSVAYGWNESQLRAAVTAEFDYTGVEGGEAGASARQIKELAAQYLVPLGEQVIDRWTEQIVKGGTDLEGFRSYLVEQAKSLFPGMAAALDKGVTVAQYADPYRQVAARELEVSPDSIDLTEPRYRKMLDQMDSKGNRVAMTLSQASEYLRTQPEWQQTRGANEKAASLTENILRSFGKVG